MTRRWLWWPLLPLAAGMLPAAAFAEAPTEAAATWALRAQGQLPVIAANHAVGGIGVAVAGEKGPWAIGAEAQFLAIVVCDSPCGSAYEAGAGVAFQPEFGRGIRAHFELLARVYAQPALHQYVPALGPRVGLRWPDHGSAVSFDVGVSFAAARNFDEGGFARNKVLGWGIPEVALGLWL